MCLTIKLPGGCTAERRYTVALVMDEFLGLQVRMVEEQRSDVAIVGEDGKELVLADRFFADAKEYWLDARSMPRRPLRSAELPREASATAGIRRQLPVVFGDNHSTEWVVRESPSRLQCSVDVLGTVFFLISRYEEMVTPVQDVHGRFPAEKSLAYQEGFLDRPLVDEYVELLWWLLTQQWPQLERKRRRYRLLLSHDVDTPYLVVGRSPLEVAAGAAADVALGRGIHSAAGRLQNALRVYREGEDADPYNTFSFIMSTSEEHSVESAFYFITRRLLGRLDGTCRLQSPRILDLIREIHDRGHEVGVHPGYSTYRDSEEIATDFRLLREQCDRLGVRQELWGGRQHYLRWKNPTTWVAWEQAGLDYDSTVGYARDVGFRCGTCREFPVYDLVHRRPLKLRERPLIVMECALSYARPRPSDECFRRVAELVARCRQFRGNFTLLWHNNNLVSAEQRRWYREIVNMAA
jgi:hypothetical protein